NENKFENKNENENEQTVLSEKSTNQNAHKIIDPLTDSKNVHKIIDPLTDGVNSLKSNTEFGTGFYRSIGRSHLKNTALVILSGGEGSRFKFDGPKGCFRIDSLNMTIFELHFKRIREIEKENNLKLNIIIMTSETVHLKVVEHILKYNNKRCCCSVITKNNHIPKEHDD
ncbi:putative UDP-N-acetylglucosamine pyrophosphorylase, partial [Pseudoloma neurophilia]